MLPTARKVEPGWPRRWLRQGYDLFRRRPADFTILFCAFGALDILACIYMQALRWAGAFHQLATVYGLFWIYIVKLYAVLSLAYAADEGGSAAMAMRSSWRDAARFGAGFMALLAVLSIPGVVIMLATGHPDALRLQMNGLGPDESLVIFEWQTAAWSSAWAPGVWLAARFGCGRDSLLPMLRLLREGMSLNAQVVLSVLIAAILVSFGIALGMDGLDPASPLRSLYPVLAVLPVIPMGLLAYLFAREVFDGRSENRAALPSAVLSASA